MHYSSIPPKDLSVSANPRDILPEKCFFFERPDGKIIQVGEQEAWNIYRGRNQVIGKGRVIYKYIGQSNGVEFLSAFNEARRLVRERGNIGLEESKEIIRAGFERELEIARSNTRPPSDGDKFGDGKDYI